MNRISYVFICCICFFQGWSFKRKKFFIYLCMPERDKFFILSLHHERAKFFFNYISTPCSIIYPFESFSGHDTNLLFIRSDYEQETIIFSFLTNPIWVKNLECNVSESFSFSMWKEYCYYLSRWFWINVLK